MSIPAGSLGRNVAGIVALTVVGALVGALGSQETAPVYRATATAAFPEAPQSAGGPVGVQVTGVSFDDEARIARSPGVAELAIDRLKLVQRWNEGTAPPLGQERYSLAKLLRDVAAWLAGPFRGGGGAAAEPPLTDDALRRRLAAQVLSGLTVEPGPEGGRIDLAFDDPIPSVAATVANGVAAAYVELRLQDHPPPAAAAAATARAALEEQGRTLKAAEAALAEARQRPGLAEARKQRDAAVGRVQRLTQDLAKARTALDEARSRTEQARRSDGGTAVAGAAEAAKTNAAVRARLAEYTALSDKLHALSERLRDKHPDMVLARTQLQQVEVVLRRETESALGQQQSLAEARVADLQRQLAGEQAQVDAAGPQVNEVVRLEEQVAGDRKLHAALQARAQEAEKARTGEIPAYRVVEAATVPQMPYRGEESNAPAWGALAGLGLGVVLALVRRGLG